MANQFAGSVELTGRRGAPGSHGKHMPKKKTAAKKAMKVVKKAVVSAKVAVKKAARSPKDTAKRPPRTVAKKKAASPAPKTAAAAAEPATAETSLGRPLVIQEEKLYMLFHDDYQCRQVFEFLRVETVKELEEFTPQQIVHLMSRPIRLTVDRIRQRLAQFKRSLKDDEQFAAEFRQGSAQK